MVKRLIMGHIFLILVHKVYKMRASIVPVLHIDTTERILC